MNHDYADITSLIDRPPKWWDEHAVPRYCDFSPTSLSNIYAREAVLLLIACQGCGRGFYVAMSTGSMDRVLGRLSLTQLVERDEIHYGDPPNTWCCPAGWAMNSVPARVVEFWRRDRAGWERVADLERPIGVDWMPAGESTDASETGGGS